MRFREVFCFEVGYHFRQPATWLYLVLLLLLPLLLTIEADPAGSYFNAPTEVAQGTLLIGLVGMLVTAALFVAAGHRDLRWRIDPFFYTAPLRKRDYLGGRFFGTLLVNALLLLAVPAGMLLSTRMPAIRPEMLGPFRPEAYLLPYLFFLLPNLLVSAAVLFGIIVLSRRSLPGYLGGLGLLAANMFALTAAGGLESEWVAALVDPTGMEASTQLTADWTPAEQNTLLIELDGMLLWNRLLWTALSLAILAFIYLRFRFRHAEPGGRRQQRKLSAATASAVPTAGRQSRIVVPLAPRSFGIRARAQQMLATAASAFRQTVLSREFLITTVGLFLLALGMANEVMSEGRYGTPLWPLTHKVAASLTHRYMELIVALLTVFYAGELVWRERDTGIEKIGDSVPVPDWVLFIGKLLALGGMLVVLQPVLMGSGMLAQALQGYYAFEPKLYLQILFGLQLLNYLLFAVLALLVHVLVNRKYFGHLVAVLVFVAILQAGRFGVEHNLLIYGSDPGWIYSDMSGFGSFLEPFVWFKLYWTAWALLLGFVAFLFWVRGTETGWRRRLRLARQRFSRRVAAGAAAAILLVLATGGFVFYNTNVLNEYRTAWEEDELDAEYERRYKRFEHTPQPWLTGMRLHVEVYPALRKVAINGTYHLVNRSDKLIDSVHVSSVPYAQVMLRRIRFDHPSEPVLEDVEHGYRIYALERALRPGDSLRMHFQVDIAPRGFRNWERTRINMAVTGNGTFLHARRLLPAIGYQREVRELSDATKRREHGLSPRSVRRSIDDPRARRIPSVASESDWIDLETTIGTTRSQTAVAPGVLRDTWTKDDRRYFRYRTETPVGASFGLISAEYAVHRARWNDVDIRVLYHPGHAFNLDRMVRDVRLALEYFSDQFGPYPYHQLLLAELPHYQPFTAVAYPGQFMYSEDSAISLGRMTDDEAEAVNAPLLTTAHELAHQWWGYQLMGADVQGAPVLSETLAQYSALMVLEQTYGPAAVRRPLRTMQIEYLNGRGRHTTPEVPLLLTSDHDYIYYHKGAVVMYALQDYIGEERVNTALRRLVRNYGMQGLPYPTTLDLYDELQAVTPDSLQYLLEDLLATITLWDLRAITARAEPTGGGEYHVTLDVEAAKLRADSIGNHTEVPMNDLVEVGVFAAAGEGESLYLEKHRIRSGRQTITVTVPGKPARAGIDPYQKLINRHKEGIFDKVREVKAGQVRADADSEPN